MDWKQLFGGTSAETTTIIEVDPAEAQRRYGDGALLVDVREQDEFDAGHAPGAEILPLGKLGASLRELPAGREILFICRSGRRSGIATEMASRAGLKAVNVRGGMIAWSRDGLPVER